MISSHEQYHGKQCKWCEDCWGHKIELVLACHYPEWCRQKETVPYRFYQGSIYSCTFDTRTSPTFCCWSHSRNRTQRILMRNQEALTSPCHWNVLFDPQQCPSDRGSLVVDGKVGLNTLIDVIRDEGHSVKNSHKYESWKDGWWKISHLVETNRECWDSPCPYCEKQF